MKVKTLLLGNMQTNCYIVSDDDHHCFIVDPGEDMIYLQRLMLEISKVIIIM